VAYQVVVGDAEMFAQQFMDVARQSLRIVAFQRTRAVSQSAKIRRDQPVAGREPCHDVPPFEPGLRPSVQQHHRKAAPGADVVHDQPGKTGVVMGEVRIAQLNLQIMNSMAVHAEF